MSIETPRRSFPIRILGLPLRGFFLCTLIGTLLSACSAQQPPVSTPADAVDNTVDSSVGSSADETREIPSESETEPSTEQGSDQDTSQDTEWFDRLLEREVGERPPLTSFAATDGTFEAAAQAKLQGTIENAEGNYSISLDVGAEEPVTCILFAQDQDMASALAVSSKENFALIESSFESLESKTLLDTSAGATEGGISFMTVDWIYTVKAEGETQAGHIKHALARLPNRGLYCGHNEVGYKKTFQQTFQELADSFVWRDPAPQPYLKEIFLLYLAERPIGLVQEAYLRDGDGDTRSESLTSMMIPVSDSELQVSDSYSIQFSTPDGRLINAIEAEAQGDQLVTNLSLIPQEDDTWLVQGLYQGKDLEENLGEEDLRSSLGQLLDLQDFLPDAAVGDTLETAEWLPGADPTQFSVTTIELLEPLESGYKVKIDAGLLMEAEVDAKGNLRLMSATMGHLSFRGERIYQHGSLSGHRAQPASEPSPEAPLETP
ncbi:MAG: hypothetical protein K0U98_05015 [Deltaproteobacteria bacterium]|nr:hypothetical protein [Deltaproteobacteria bacterium]